jgi:hypothetical protein
MHGSCRALWLSEPLGGFVSLFTDPKIGAKPGDSSSCISFALWVKALKYPKRSITPKSTQKMWYDFLGTTSKPFA